MMYGGFAHVFRFFISCSLEILLAFGWEGDLALYVPNRCIIGGLAFHMHLVVAW